MKKYILLLLTLITLNIFSQIEDPVDWHFSIDHIENDVYDLIVEATIEKGWNVYSQYVDPDGPIPTSFVFFDSKNESPIRIIMPITDPIATIFHGKIPSPKKPLARLANSPACGAASSLPPMPPGVVS